jgi:hypothetical protein
MSNDLEKWAVLTTSGLLLMFFNENVARASCIRSEGDRFFVRQPGGDFQEESE